MQMRVNRSIHTAQEGGPQCRKFWQTLKGKKPKQDVHCIKDPGSNKIIFDRHKMNQSIMHYWGTLGKMNMSLNDNEDCNSIGVKSSVDNLRLLFDLNANINDGNNCLSNIDLNIDIITDAIKKCKNNKAHGLDEISNELLTNGGTCLNQSILCLFRKLFELQSTPSQWNKGIIVPIFKKGTRNDLNNYRGITLTCCISKIFNRIIANAVSDFLEQSNAFSEVQGGFRKKLSLRRPYFYFKEHRRK